MNINRMTCEFIFALVVAVNPANPSGFAFALVTGSLLPLGRLSTRLPTWPTHIKLLTCEDSDSNNRIKLTQHYTQ